MNGFRRGARGVCVLALGSLLGGCAGLHWHSEKREMQGEALQKAWSAVDIDSYFAEIRQQRNALVERELANTRQYVLSQRGAQLAGLTLHPVDGAAGLRAMLGKELATLAGAQWDLSKKVEQATNLKGELIGLRSLIAAENREVSFDAALASIHAGSQTGCDAGDRTPASQPTASAAGNNAARQAQARLAARCQRLVDLQRQWDATLQALGGTIGIQLDRVAELERAVTEERRLAAAQRVIYLQALADYEQVAADLAAHQDGGALLRQRAEQLRAAMGMLAAVGNVFASESAALERLGEIDRLLSSLSGADQPHPDDPRLQRALAIVPAIASDLQAATGNGPQAIRYSLRIRRDVEAVRLRQATQLAALRANELELARAVLQAQVDELVSLLSAVIALGAQRETNLSLVADLEAGDVARRRAVAETLAHYLDAKGEHEARVAVLQQKAANTHFEKVMLHSEANARQWANLIGVSAAAASSYAGAGLKSGDFKDLIQTAALLWIGQGVHK